MLISEKRNNFKKGRHTFGVNWLGFDVKKVVDDLEFSIEELSEFRLGQLKSIEFLESQVKLIEAEITMHETAQTIFKEMLNNKRNR